MEICCSFLLNKCLKWSKPSLSLPGQGGKGGLFLSRIYWNVVPDIARSAHKTERIISGKLNVKRKIHF